MKRIYNLRTSPLFLPVYDEAEVTFKDEVVDDDGLIRFAMRRRSEPRCTETKLIEGCHNERMHDPNHIDVSEKDFKAMAKCPGFEGLQENKWIRVEEI